MRMPSISAVARLTRALLTALSVGVLLAALLAPSAALADQESSARESPGFQAQKEETKQAEQPGTSLSAGLAAAKAPCDSLDLKCYFLQGVDLIVDAIFILPLLLAQTFFVQILDINLSAFQPGNFAAYATDVGFPVVLGVANMFFVLILLWIAIATIFDFEPYTARSLLLKLIIAALLINFSLPIGRAVINLSNGIGRIFYDNITAQGSITLAVVRMFNVEAIQKAFLEAPPPGLCAGLSRGDCAEKVFGATQKKASDGQVLSAAGCHQILNAPGAVPGLSAETLQEKQTICTHLVKLATLETNKAMGEDVYTLLAMATGVKILVYPIAIFVLFAAAILLVSRIVALTFLLILGPLAFLSLILPAMRQFWTMWWDRLFKWSFFLPAFMFFFWLTFAVIRQIPRSFFTAQVGSQQVLDVWAAMGSYLLAAAFMIGGLIVSSQLGIHGASMVTGWGKGMSKAAGKWTKDRGWKYAGKAAEGAMRVPGLRQAIGRLPPLRAGAVATMTRGAAVTKKDTEFYTKLGDKNLIAALGSMRPGLARSVLEALPGKRVHKSKQKEELLGLYRKLGVSIPGRPTLEDRLDAAEDEIEGKADKT